MAKRFTDTDKFIDPWFRRLSSKHKLLWDYLCCNCTHAGIICVDLDFIEMVLDEKFDDDVLQKHFSERLLHIEKNKYFIPKFISFQYGELNSEFRIHKQIIKKLEKEGINPLTLHISSRTVHDSHEQSMKVHESSHRVKEQEQEQDKEQNKEQDSSKFKEEAKKNLPEIQTQEKPKSQKSVQVITILNSLTGSTYMATPSLCELIDERIKEGFKLEDFKAVILFKKEQWSNDPKTRGWFRPETIFGEKMNSYLQESRNAFKTILETDTQNPYKKKLAEIRNNKVSN